MMVGVVEETIALEDIVVESEETRKERNNRKP